jgi:lipoprotein-anchoring transpeptidase ErfK/SrfK
MGQQTLDNALGTHIIIEPSNFKGLLYKEKFGFNPSVPAGGTFEDIWFNSTDIQYLANGVEEFHTVQSSGNDNGVGSSGAQKIIIEGLSSDGTEISEEVILNAAVDPVTKLKYWRINRSYVTDVGSNGTNENNITITAQTAGTVQAAIGATLGQTEKSQYTIPKGKEVRIFSWTVSCGKAEDFDCELITREYGKGWRVRKRILVFQNEYVSECFIQLPALADIKVRATSITTASKPLATSYRFVEYNG